MTNTVIFRQRNGRATLRALAAGCFLFFLAVQSPHLVHHLFEPAQQETDCAFASNAERAQGLTTDVVTLIPTPQVEAGEWVSDPLDLPSPALAPADARAPPLLAS